MEQNRQTDNDREAELYGGRRNELASSCKSAIIVKRYTGHGPVYLRQRGSNGCSQLDRHIYRCSKCIKVNY